MSISQSREKIHALTTDFLENKKAFSPENMEELKQVIRFHDRLYYVDSQPVLDDYDYDFLFKSLKELEASHPELVSPDSPTQRISKNLNEKFQSVPHSVPMLSLDNSYNEHDLIEFDRRIRDKIGENHDLVYVVEPKYDGSGIALLYENDILVRAATRGDGTMGEDITANARVLNSIPLYAPFSKYGIQKAEVRGEVVIEKNRFEEINAERAKQGLQIFQNSRNTASGGLRMKDPSKIAERGMEAFVYHLGYAVDKMGSNVLGRMHDSHHAALQMLKDMGFKVPVKEFATFEKIEAAAAYCRQWEDQRERYNYDIDGMVVKLDQISLQEEAGYTAHHPRWAMAYKFKAKQVVTRLLNIEYQVGRTGAITPVAKLDPVRLAGVTISSVSLHNAEFIEGKDIRLGDFVIVERAGDVIPYISGVKTEMRKGVETEVLFPKTCPACNHTLVKEEEEAVWRCDNRNCSAQLEERLIHFVSKGAMDIDGLGKDIVKRFLAEGLISDITSLYRIDYKAVLQMEGWKEKSVQNLKEGIELSKSKEIWRLLVALGLRHIGKTMAKTLCENLSDLRQLKTMNEDELLALNDVGPKVVESIGNFFSDEENRNLLDKLEQLGVNLKQEVKAKQSGKFDNMTFLFTGTLEKMNRDEAKDIVESLGGKVLSGVSKNLNILVAGSSAGSKLTKAQAIDSIRILTEEEFLKMI